MPFCAVAGRETIRKRRTRIHDGDRDAGHAMARGGIPVARSTPPGLLVVPHRIGLATPIEGR
jgi:hypothetical protein